MTDPDEADRRIERLEHDLAQLQADSAYRQIEANLVRARLKTTLEIAVGVIGRLSAGFDASITQMADDLNGGGQG